MNVMTNPAALDIERIRADFPILTQTVRGKPLVFLDSAASAQKPRVVIDAMVNAMETQYANVHRGLHWMSERTTEAYEAARDAAAALMNANDRSEIVFTGNSTDAINLLAHSYGRGVLKPGQAVLISGMEHHSNIVPWQMLRDAHGIELRVAPITDAGELDMAAFEGAAGGRQGRPRRDHPYVQRARHRHAGGTDRQHRPRIRRQGDVRRLAGDRASQGRRAGAGLRFLRLDRPQAVRPDRHRRALGPEGTAGADAAVLRRRRHDFIRDLRKIHLGRRAAQVRGRHAGDPGRHRPEGRDRLRAGDRLRRHGGARGRADRTRAGPAVERPGSDASSARRRTAAASSPSPWTRPMPTTSPPCSTGRASPCAPAIIAPNR